MRVGSRKALGRAATGCHSFLGASSCLPVLVHTPLTMGEAGSLGENPGSSDHYLVALGVLLDFSG